VGVWTSTLIFVRRLVAGFCEHTNELSDSIEGVEFFY
jgi:hypothetical protein